ncbi:MAG: ankyrin repeat domain-containing protein [Tenuifilum sp.]|uniref:ankyrin repeat domain-containing protein n=1 Tax=Tenuifilum sp. TaxID=2760880 RepID=UPI0030A01FC5
MKFKLALHLLAFTTFLFVHGFAQDNTSYDSLVVTFINENNISKIDGLIKVNGINKTYFNNSHTLLTLAISNSNLNLVKYLVDRGANVNIVLNTLSPLIQCAIYDKDTIAEYLLTHGAIVDVYNIQRNTPLLYAARVGSVNTLKVLMRFRANPFFQNFQNYNSLEYALSFGKTEAANLLRDYMVAYSKGIYPSCFDGPHVERISKRRARVFYLVNDSINSKVFVESKTFRITNSVFSFKGFYATDSINYTVNFNKPSMYSEKETVINSKAKIFAVGDVHGEYDSLAKLLFSNSIVDKNLNWIFGDGHLVFIGDLVDRGERVTEVLWLVYRLTEQAELSGGRVYTLMGNHETIILNNDNRYIHEKYQILTRGNKISYSDLFSKNVWPGAMVRNFKAGIVIDSILFVHAGISYQLAQKNIPLVRMNQLLDKLYNPDNSFLIDPDVFLNELNLIFSEYGLLWYRGYLLQTPTIPKATQSEISYVLKTFGANQMVIGHTEVDSIAPLYSGMLFPINVPFARRGIVPQGLLIDETRKFWSCSINGQCILIK